MWQLQAADAGNPYVLPIIKGAVSRGDLSLQQAQWIDRSTIMWKIDAKPDYTYALHYAPDGGITLANNQISGGQSIRLFVDPNGLSAEQLAKWPQLAGYTMFRLQSKDLPLVPEILKGQIAVSAGPQGFAVEATGVQIPGVLDDLYTYGGALGVTFAGGVPTIAVWAPTARSVALHLFDSSTSVPASQIVPMTPGDKGVWSVTGDATWKNKYYLFDVEVYVPGTGKVEHNVVTDPYSLGLSINSTRSMIVDLDDPRPQAFGLGQRAQARPGGT